MDYKITNKEIDQSISQHSNKHINNLDKVITVAKVVIFLLFVYFILGDYAGLVFNVFTISIAIIVLGIYWLRKS